MRAGLFGLTQGSWSFVKRITPGMPLFLYNLTERRFHGVFEAVRARASSPKTSSRATRLRRRRPALSARKISDKIDRSIAPRGETPTTRRLAARRLRPPRAARRIPKTSPLSRPSTPPN
jgi:hypothetical protein